MAKPRELSFKEIKKFAEDEFQIHFPTGEDFLDAAYLHASKERFNTSSYQLHQACERFYNSISLVFKNDHPKAHKLNELGAGVKDYSRDLVSVFPLHTDFEKRCFDLLCRAYIEARYNKDFVVTKEELAYMFEQTEVLKAITLRICTEKIASYDDL